MAYKIVNKINGVIMCTFLYAQRQTILKIMENVLITYEISTKKLLVKFWKLTWDNGISISQIKL